MNKSNSRLSAKTAVKSTPILIGDLFKGNLSLLKYHVKNGLLNRLGFKFPEDMIKFFDGLPNANCVNNKYLELKDKIAIMTFDDVFDDEIYKYEKSIGALSTTFLLSYKLQKDLRNYDLDLQLHFDKRYSPITVQIEKFKKSTGRKPIINRNHSLWWNYTHHDLLYLAMNEIKVDSSLNGFKPFRLCLQGKLLPIWEVPFNVCDSESIMSAPYTVSGKMEALFAKSATPIVGLFHSYLKHKSNWKDFYKFADKYNYKLMTMSQFYDEYLRGK